MPTRNSRRAAVRVKGLTPFLWFDGDAEPAARLYVSLFARSKIRHIARYGEYLPEQKGKVITVDFEIAGQPLVGINGGPEFKLSPAFSLMVVCPTQREVDVLWRQLSRGGEVIRCGWLTDRFGVTWQIVPERFLEMLRNKDPAKVDRAMAAMMKMKKLVVRDLERAYRGK